MCSDENSFTENKIGFNKRCYKLLRQVPLGKVTTYKVLAETLNTKAYRAVGRAMKKNPYAPEVPCHRVIYSNGNIGGFSKGIFEKLKLLESEGVEAADGKIDLKRYGFFFN